MKIFTAVAAAALALTGLAAPAAGQDDVLAKHSSVRSVHHRRVYHRTRVVRVRRQTQCRMRYDYGKPVRVCRTVYRRY